MCHILNNTYEVLVLFFSSVWATGSTKYGLAGGRLVGSVYVRAAVPRGYFGMLAVHPDHEGHGLGRSLIDAAEARCSAAACDLMEMSVVSVMEHLVAWCRRLGYEAYGTEPYIEPERELKMPVHFILMARPLRGVPVRYSPWKAFSIS